MVPAATIEAENASVVEMVEAARTLVETTQTTLEGLDGAAKNELAKSLANMLNSVAKRIDG
jgi:hypothetical protein